MVFPSGGRGALPGLTPRVDQVQNNFLKDPDHWMTRGVVIDSTAVDAGSSPTTKLRPGLVLVRVESGAKKNKYVEIGNADDPGTGSRIKAVILMEGVFMQNRDLSAVEDKNALGLFHGWVDQSKVIFGTANVPDIDDIIGVLDLVEFEAKL